MAISRITAEWSGFRGAPGYSNFYFDGELEAGTTAEVAGSAIRSFFFEIRSELPSTVNIQVNPSAEIIDEATGQILSVIDYASPAGMAGLGEGGYSAASGAVVNWNTAAYVNGRRVRGRTFVVPLSAGSYDSSGDLTSSALTDLRAAATDHVGRVPEAPPCVWHRPVNGAGGSAHVITSATVPDLGAVLRSRRD